MREVVLKIVNAFSIHGTGGNPAGVVLNADPLTSEHKQRIAARAGLSEIAFVSKSNAADFKLDFFTPTRQIAHCGHATIATFTYLKQQGQIKGDRSSKETIDGNRDIYFEKGYAFMEQRSPMYTDVRSELTEILQSLNLSNNDLAANQFPVIVNTGNSFLIVPVANSIVLKNIEAKQELVSKYSEKYGLIGYYVFSPSEDKRAVASTRMFAPYYGIDEEAATGMAAGPLACYLYDNKFIDATEVIIRQGEYMSKPSPSLITVKLILEDKKIKKLYAGGDAYVSQERIIQY